MFKKLFLLFISVFLVFTLAFIAFTPAFASELPDLAALKATDRNSYSAEIYWRLLDCFPIVLVQTINGEDEIVRYPDEFAGAFIDESNNLHIVLTKDVDMKTEYDYRKITGYDEDIVFEVAEFPLFFLYEVQRALDGFMMEYNIEATLIDTRTNRLNIHLFDQSKEKDIVEFLRTRFDKFDDNCLIFGDPLGITPAYDMRATDNSTPQNPLQSNLIILLAAAGIVASLIAGVAYLRRRRTQSSQAKFRDISTHKVS